MVGLGRGRTESRSLRIAVQDVYYTIPQVTICLDLGMLCPFELCFVVALVRVGFLESVLSSVCGMEMSRNSPVPVELRTWWLMCLASSTFRMGIPSLIK